MTVLPPPGVLIARGSFRRPVFVVGVGRSGTSVLTGAVGRHPRILSASGESPFLGHVGELLAPLERGPEKERSYHRRSLRLPREELDERLRRLCFETALGPRLGFWPSVKDVLRGLAGRRERTWRCRRWCAKTFPNREGFRGLRALYPEGRFLYIVRNGMDVVRSRMKYPGFRDAGFRANCEAWAGSVKRYAYLQEASEALTVRHEDLVGDPEVCFRRAFAFLEMEFDPAPVDFVEGTMVSPLDEPTRRDVDVRKALRDRPPAHEGWSEEERETFRTVCGAAMARTRYEIPY